MSNFEECLFYKPTSCSADFVKDATINFRTQPSLNKSVLDNIKSNLTKIQRHHEKEFTARSRKYLFRGNEFFVLISLNFIFLHVDKCELQQEDV